MVKRATIDKQEPGNTGFFVPGINGQCYGLFLLTGLWKNIVKKRHDVLF
jgi:hypothetical protein